MIATTREIDLTVYTVLGSDADALQKDFTASEQVHEWTWPPTGPNKMIDPDNLKTDKRSNDHPLEPQQKSYSWRETSLESPLLSKT